jgi:hypothetical protein
MKGRVCRRPCAYLDESEPDRDHEARAQGYDERV